MRASKILDSSMVYHYLTHTLFFATSQSIVRTYPKLKGSEQEFEFGFNLKIYPDDQIEVAVKSTSISSGPSIGNWISNLLSPIDSSNVQ